MNRKHNHTFILFATLIAALLVACVALRYGSTYLPLSDLLQGLLHRDPSDTVSNIVWVVRLPRVLGCLLCGAALSFSGVLLQVSTNNPLAGPNIIGVNAGAGFAMTLCLCFAPMAYCLLPLAAFVGAFACSLLIVSLANRAGGSRVTIVLAGVAISTLLNAGISFLKLLYPDTSIAYNYFSVGSVDGVMFTDIAIPALITLFCLVLGMCLAGRLNLLLLGDSIAQTLGVRAKFLRTVALILASASAAAAVSFAGLLGFVGLMVPHIARKLLNTSDVKKLIPESMLLGGILVTLADLLGRVVFAPSQIPAGIITAFVGAPFFFILLLQRRNRL